MALCTFRFIFQSEWSDLRVQFQHTYRSGPGKQNDELIVYLALQHIQVGHQDQYRSACITKFQKQVRGQLQNMFQSASKGRRPGGKAARFALPQNQTRDILAWLGNSRSFGIPTFWLHATVFASWYLRKTSSVCGWICWFMSRFNWGSAYTADMIRRLSRR